jgi:hypothetical protein
MLYASFDEILPTVLYGHLSVIQTSAVGMVGMRGRSLPPVMRKSVTLGMGKTATVDLRIREVQRYGTEASDQDRCSY